ncbi:MAG TPA: UDP-glucose 4-epimerase GalE [Candidatus Dormibacteraeota bacterium]|nr:UDP-glucose 4-epimerase GalE [Candidatus Dormibacteraeota bacterium]
MTGGAGYIGSHTAKLLAQMGCEPIVFDNLSTGHLRAVRWGPLVRGDLDNAALLRSTLDQYHIQAVIHFAASAYVGESMRKPRQYFQNNVVNSLNLLDVLVDTGIQHIVFSSTCATYGMATAVPIPEDHPQLPVNPYGESKRFLERALYWHGEAYGLRWVALRYFNAAGADLEGEIGEMHSPETHLIPLAMDAASGCRPSLDVYGTDYPTPDGTAIRDYIHVTDLAAAHVLALKYLLNGNKSVALNLGTGKGHSVREVVAQVERSSCQPVKIREAARRPGDPPVLVADPSRASELLGWRPRHSGLDTIVESAWSWHKAHCGRKDDDGRRLILTKEPLVNADWQQTPQVISGPTVPGSAKWL